MQFAEAEGMGPGKKGQGPIIGIQLRVSHHSRMVVACPVAVHQENPLGVSRGSGRIDEDGHFFRLRIDGLDRILFPYALQFSHGGFSFTLYDKKLLQGGNP